MGKIKAFAPKSNIVIEGQATRGLYILLHGTVSVYKNDRSNQNMIRLAYLEAGAAFGELSLFDDAPRSATVISEAHCFLFCLDIAVFDDFLTTRGDNIRFRFYRKCAEEMAARFRQQNSDYIISQKLLWAHALRKKKEENPES